MNLNGLVDDENLSKYYFENNVYFFEIFRKFQQFKGKT